MSASSLLRVGRDGPDGGRRRRRPPAGRRRRRRIAALLVLALLAWPGVSFAQAMTYPGSAPASVRAVEWVREHGGGGLVDTVEAWWYSHNAPPSRGRPADALSSGAPVAGPTASSSATAAAPVGAARTAPQPPAPTVLPRVRLLPLPAVSGEGRWTVAATAAGRPSLFTTWLRPDARHTPVVAGVALIPQRVDALHLVAGTTDPPSSRSWPEGSRIPTSAYPRLVAAFNAGWKTKDVPGGWFGDGRTVKPLVAGQASLVITKDGRATVGVWGKGLTMTPQVVAVRQNLRLIVQDGAPAPGLDANAGQRWGSSRNQFEYTWRSGIGIDRAADLVYVAGGGLTLQTLAAAMTRAGVVTGMELDIHSQMVTMNIFTPRAAGRPLGRRLLTDMNRPAGRYLVSDQRDFFYVTTR